jgi:hypothetical protein
MKKGHLIKKENSWFVRTVTSIEGDDVIITDYLLSLTSSYYAGFSLKEGKEVNFEIETEVYSGLFEEEPLQWAVLQSPITRVEVINNIGKVFSHKGNAEVSFEDGGKTCKIFI